MKTPPVHPFRELAPLLIALIVAVVLLFVGGVARVVILALLLAYILDPVATALEARGMSRMLAVLLILFVLIGSVVGLAVILFPIVVEQLQGLQTGGTPEKAAAAIKGIEESLKANLSFIGMGDLDLLGRIEAFKKGIVESIFAFVLSDFLSLLITVVTIPFMMFFFLKDGREMKKALVGMVPNRYFEFTMDLLYKMDTQLGNYLRGQFIDALVFGGMAIIALWIVGVPYFVFLGIFSGLANLIPYVGPLAGGAASVLVSVLSTGDLGSAVPVIGAYVVLQLLDDFVVTPSVVATSVQLHPVIVLIAIIVGGELYGVLGMLLAIPVTGFIKVVLREGITTYRKYRFT